jgi:hypothetical protein
MSLKKIVINGLFCRKLSQLILLILLMKLESYEDLRIFENGLFGTTNPQVVGSNPPGRA